MLNLLSGLPQVPPSCPLCRNVSKLLLEEDGAGPMAHLLQSLPHPVYHTKYLHRHGTVAREGGAPPLPLQHAQISFNGRLEGDGFSQMTLRPEPPPNSSPIHSCVLGLFQSVLSVVGSRVSSTRVA
jgi:hypothetical protein